MGTKRIAIPIGRFEASRPLANDVFLHLVLNQKTIRLVQANDTFSAELLERIKNKGYSHLEIQHEGDNLDPNTFPLYLSAEISSETPTGFKVESGTNLEKLLIAAPALAEQQAAAITNAEQDPAASQKIANTTEPESSQRIKASAETEESTKVSGTEAEDAELTHLGGSSALDPTLSGISLSAQDEEEASTFGQTRETNSDASLSGPAENEDEASFGGSTESAPVVFKVKSDSEKDDEEDLIFQLEQKIEMAKETLLAGGKFDLELEMADILRGAKSTILVGKISDRIIELSKLPDPKRIEELKELANSLDSAKAGRELPEETLAQFSFSSDLKEVESIISANRPETDRIIDLSDHLAAYAKTREEAKSYLDENASELNDPAMRKSAGHRDLPVIASRLAAYLGHSLGYTHQKFLYDLAVTSICHFGKKNGKVTATDSLPALAILLQTESEEESPVVNDTRDILSFLELYLEDPECNRTDKDFSPKVFKRAAELAGKSTGVNPWNLKCWNSYIDQGGPTLETHGACNRAAAHASKFLRTNAVNE